MCKSCQELIDKYPAYLKQEDYDALNFDKTFPIFKEQFYEEISTFKDVPCILPENKWDSLFNNRELVNIIIADQNSFPRLNIIYESAKMIKDKFVAGADEEILDELALVLESYNGTSIVANIPFDKVCFGTLLFTAFIIDTLDPLMVCVHLMDYATNGKEGLNKYAGLMLHSFGLLEEMPKKFARIIVLQLKHACGLMPREGEFETACREFEKPIKELMFRERLTKLANLIKLKE